MKTKYKIFMAGLVMALVSSGMLSAQERAEEGEVRGTFVRIEAEQRPGPEEFEHAPRREFEHRELAEGVEKVRAKLAELKEAAEQAEREGRHDKAAKLHEKAEKIAEKIEQHARKAKDRMPAEAEELERRLKREFERREMAERWPEGGRRPEPWRRVGPERPEGIRERREPPGPWAHLEHLEKQLKDVLAVHLERMAGEFRELLTRVERMERELQELRAENARLKSQLREGRRSRIERETEVREQRGTEEHGLRRERRQR